MTSKKHTLIILANGLGTRMATSKPKTLIKLATNETILGRLLSEANTANSINKIYIFVRHKDRELESVLGESALPVEIVVREPEGYFHDLAEAKQELCLDEFSVVDSDLVAQTGEIARFLDIAPKKNAWVAIGVTAFPERPSGRPAWVSLDAQGRILELYRDRKLTHRTVGIFHWGDIACTIPPKLIPRNASVMAYIAEHLGEAGGVHGLAFSHTVNVNSKEDIMAANKLVLASTKRI